MSSKLQKTVISLTLAVTLMFSVIWGTLSYNGNSPNPTPTNSAVVNNTTSV